MRTSLRPTDAMAQLQTLEQEPREAVRENRPVLQALRDLDGRATLGDVVARTGLARAEVESALRGLLETRRGHLDVSDDGTLLYRFDPKLIRRDRTPFWERFKRTAWDVFQKAFKVWIVLMLVVYFVIFVVLLLAAMFAGNRDGDGGEWGGGDRRGGHGHGHFPSFWFWYLLWSPDWRWGRPYYGHRWEERFGGKAKVPFYKKVFAAVFGPDRPQPTQRQKDRSVLRLVRARGGALTAAELVEHTGLPLHEADEEMARLMATHGGDVQVSPEGELVYVFEELMVSAHGRVDEREPDPAWRRLEPKVELTGNDRGTDALVFGLNGFNLLAAATAPLFIFPRLGLGGTLAWAGLVWVPVAFSTAFYAIPLARWWTVARENARRTARNVRKVLVGKVIHESLVGDGPQPVDPREMTRVVQQMLRDERVGRDAVDRELLRLTAEFDADVTAEADGEPRYRFGEIRRQFDASRALREQLSLGRRELGEIVYSSEDTPEELGRRDLEAFDRELERGREMERGEQPAGYLPDVDRVAYVHDFELVAFDEEMERRRRGREKAPLPRR